MTKTSIKSTRQHLAHGQEAALRGARSREGRNEPLTLRRIAAAAGFAFVWVGLWLAFITWVLATLIG